MPKRSVTLFRNTQHPFEQRSACLIEFLGGLHVGQRHGQLAQVFERHALAQAGVHPGQAGQLVQRRHRVAGPVHLLDAPRLLRVELVGCEQARPVEVQERVEVLGAVGVEARGVALRDVCKAELLAHHGPVLGLGQAVVVAVARAAAGELDLQLVQHLGHPVVDVLAAVVGVEAQDLERELFEHLLDDGQQVGFADGLHRGHHLPLSDAVHRVDVVQALDAVLVALVNAVDADEARAAFRSWGLAHSDGNGLGGARLGQHHALRPVRCAVAQGVQMPDGEVAQALETSVLEHIALAAQHAGRGGPGCVPMARSTSASKAASAARGWCRSGAAGGPATPPCRRDPVARTRSGAAPARSSRTAPRHPRPAETPMPAYRQKFAAARKRWLAHGLPLLG